MPVTARAHSSASCRPADRLSTQLVPERAGYARAVLWTAAQAVDKPEAESPSWPPCREACPPLAHLPTAFYDDDFFSIFSQSFAWRFAPSPSVGSGFTGGMNKKKNKNSKTIVVKRWGQVGYRWASLVSWWQVRWGAVGLSTDNPAVHSTPRQSTNEDEQRDAFSAFFAVKRTRRCPPHKLL